MSQASNVSSRPPRFDDLRGSYITNMIRAGKTIDQVKRWAGHTKATITLEIYTKMLESDPEVLAMKANTGDGK